MTEYDLIKVLQDDNILVSTNTVHSFLNKSKEYNNTSLYTFKESHINKGESQSHDGFLSKILSNENTKENRKSEFIKKLEEDWASESEDEDLTSRDNNHKGCKKYNNEAKAADNTKLSNENSSGSAKIMELPRTSQTGLKDNLSTKHLVNKIIVLTDRACTKNVDSFYEFEVTAAQLQNILAHFNKTDVCPKSGLDQDNNQEYLDKFVNLSRKDQNNSISEVLKPTEGETLQRNKTLTPLQFVKPNLLKKNHVTKKAQESGIIEISERLDTSNLYELNEDEINVNNSLVKESLIVDKISIADINEDTILENSLFTDKLQERAMVCNKNTFVESLTDFTSENDNSQNKNQELPNNVEDTTTQEVVETLYMADKVKGNIIGKKIVKKIVNFQRESNAVLPSAGTKHNKQILIIYSSEEDEENTSKKSSSQIMTNLPDFKKNLGIKKSNSKEPRVCVKSQKGIKTENYTSKNNKCDIVMRGPNKRKISEKLNKKESKILKARNKDQIWKELVKSNVDMPKTTSINVNSNVVCEDRANHFVLKNSRNISDLEEKQGISATEPLRLQKKKANVISSNEDETTNQQKGLYQCDMCSYKTKFIASFKQHKVIHKLLDPVAQFKCHHCAYQTKTKEVLQNHLREHADLKLNYSCVSCDFAVKSNNKSNKRKKASVFWHCIQNHRSETGLDQNYCLVTNIETNDEYLECLWCCLQMSEPSDFDPHIEEHKDMGEINHQSEAAQRGGDG